MQAAVGNSNDNLGPIGLQHQNDSFNSIAPMVSPPLPIAPPQPIAAPKVITVDRSSHQHSGGYTETYEKKYRHNWSENARNHERQIDELATAKPNPIIRKNTYILTADERIVCAQISHLPTIIQQEGEKGTKVTAINLNIVGSKAEEGKKACLMITVFVSFCLIFPIFFMFCDWWKRIVYPKYEVAPKTYQTLSQTLSSLLMIQKVTLGLVDNGLNQEKAIIIYNMLERRQVSEFSMSNMALDFDWRNNEHTNFQENMEPLRRTGIRGSMFWSEKMVTF